MGHRANYIIKNENSFDIYYTHWRAQNIAQDLVLGPNRFTMFVKEFDKSNELLNEPWVEGCVLVDLPLQKLTFWENELLENSSVREEYLKYLQNIWTNWSVNFAQNEMYDIENELHIKYTSKQKIDLEFGSLENLSDKLEDKIYFSCLVIIKENDKHYIKYVDGGLGDQIALIGETVINKLKTLKNRELKNENSDDFYSCLAIDIDNKTIWVNYAIIGLREELESLWKNWAIHVGNFGYIKLLKEIGIDTTELELSSDEIKNMITNEIFNRIDDFNPNDLAKKLAKVMGEEVKYNEHFFQNIKPKKTLWNIIKGIFSS